MVSGTDVMTARQSFGFTQLELVIRATQIQDSRNGQMRTAQEILDELCSPSERRAIELRAELTEQYKADQALEKKAARQRARLTREYEAYEDAH
jgi:hypothetical protein